MQPTDQYKDILHLPRPVSGRHPRKPMADRAAQFSPFAALTGYDEAIDETARRTDARCTLCEEDAAALNHALRLLCETIRQRPAVQVTHFVPDRRKEGGSYQKTCGRVRRVDLTGRTLCFEDGTVLLLDDIARIELKDSALRL